MPFDVGECERGRRYWQLHGRILEAFVEADAIRGKLGWHEEYAGRASSSRRAKHLSPRVDAVGDLTGRLAHAHTLSPLSRWRWEGRRGSCS